MPEGLYSKIGLCVQGLWTNVLHVLPSIDAHTYMYTYSHIHVENTQLAAKDLVHGSFQKVGDSTGCIREIYIFLNTGAHGHSLGRHEVLFEIV